ncbi:Os01g0336200 [Oryza sativa Japonica Group]|uniref:Os01g0336200 protein n=1 Tax=Oryza sativa subsp. japonica TaxID=39947 RepID=A0A0P0V213_ORYSJ|nr:Os01g0336200 [Oryza sativa Japonica Group]
MATLDIVNESRPYDRRMYALYMRWYTAQTHVRLVTIADVDIPEIADVDMLYPMQSAPVTHLTGDIVEELYAETTSLWEKLRDNIAGSHEDMMSALDRMRQKCKRIMRAASCRHASDMHRPTGHRFADPLPERPSTSSMPSTSRPSTSARPSASTRPKPAVRPVEPSTIIRPDNEASTQMVRPTPTTTGVSQWHQGFTSVPGSTAVIPSIPHASTTGQWQGGFAPYAGSSQLVPPMRTEAGSSQFQGGFSGIPQINMPMFSMGTNDQWQGAHTYNTGMYSPKQRMEYAGSTQSYGKPCSYGGGSSTAHHEIGPSQLDEPPPITQPTQDYSHVDFSGVEVVRRSVRERHSPERLSLLGRRPPTGARRKGKTKVTSTS